AELDVSREQAEHRRLRQRLQVAEKLPDAGTRFAAVLLQDVLQPENVMLEEQLKMFRRGGHVVNPEKFADEAHVRAPGEFHLLRAVMQVEMFGECLGERRRARSARVNERAVNVE